MKRFLGVVVLILTLFGCRAGDRPVARFSEGEIVEIIITGERVQVVRSHKWGKDWEYKCRVTGQREKAVHGVVSMRTKTQVYPLIWFYEFELREAENVTSNQVD